MFAFRVRVIVKVRVSDDYLDVRQCLRYLGLPNAKTTYVLLQSHCL